MEANEVLNYYSEFIYRIMHCWQILTLIIFLYTHAFIYSFICLYLFAYITVFTSCCWCKTFLKVYKPANFYVYGYFCVILLMLYTLLFKLFVPAIFMQYKIWYSRMIANEEWGDIWEEMVVESRFFWKDWGNGEEFHSG